MPVELRKRKAPEPAPAPVAKKASAPKPRKTGGTMKSASTAAAVDSPAAKKADAPAATTDDVETKGNGNSNGASTSTSSKKVAVGDVIDLDTFGGEVETNDGKKTTLKKLVDESKAGVVLFTYPKASTPGCTTQVCLFRDSYEPLTADGLAIYGLSADSTKANTTFKEKQKLPYPLLCDPAATLIDAIGLKKQPKGTQRGVFVVDKQGKVLVAEPGGPAATVDRVKAIVEELKK